MKGLEFPIIGTKIEGLAKQFDLADLDSRREYFEAKAGPEITKIKEYLKTGTFMAFLVGKKASGKGTRAGMFMEIFGRGKVDLLGVGDLVREIDFGWNEFVKTEEFEALRKTYRGYTSFEDCLKWFGTRSTQGPLAPTEFILALLKVRLKKYAGKAVFIDGLPRDLDQVSYSLFFRDLANIREDPDMFMLIDTPLTVIDERIKYRVVCPKCKISRNTKLHVTRDVEYDQKNHKFLLHCDNPSCERAVMVSKEGDDLGIEPIRSRLEKDEQVLRSLLGIHGVPKILLRTHVPKDEALKYFDSYEATPEYKLTFDKKLGQVKIEERPWIIEDDNGIQSYSMVAAVDVVLMIKQLADILG